MIPGNERRHWYLPLVGGAEMNRAKPPKIIYLTSKPYPIMMEEDFANGYSGDLKFSPTAAYLEETSNAYSIVGLSITDKTGSGTYDAVIDYASTGFGLQALTITAKTTKAELIQRENASVGYTVAALALPTVLVRYAPRTDEVLNSYTLVGITRT